uniref:Uncharacterized protein n=1 Tax=Lepeophtheirus salmonis TaxID=72036 RepID=A0A0K2SVR0_LEPSM
MYVLPSSWALNSPELNLLDYLVWYNVE